MRIRRLILAAYGQCRDVAIDIGAGVTVVLGANEAGKSTALDALSDFLWGIPRSTARAFEFPRKQLRIDAVLEVDGEPATVVRKSTGLFADDLVTEVPGPWNPENRLTVQWWRTRLGINHTDLRRGGREVFDGTGDIADIIFAAREGRSAREVLRAIGERADDLFKPDGRAKKVKLRLAQAEYQRASGDRDRSLTRAGDVVAQRDTVGRLDREYHRARDDVTATSQLLKLAEEDLRVIKNVLSLRQAQREIAAIDGEGKRLLPAELVQYQRSDADFHAAEGRMTKLDNEIVSKKRSIEDLSVDDRLLDDRATLARLQSDVKARIEDLHRAADEFGPAAAESENRLQQQLRSIGIGAANDIDMAVDRARVRADQAATLDDLADRVELLEQQRQHARDERDQALTGLLADGITVDVSTSTAPDEHALGKLREALTQARIDESTAQRLLTETTDTVQAMHSGTSTPHGEAVLTHAAVVEARRSRDAQWSTIRRSWVSGELPVSAERVDMAAELDKQFDAADRVADDEATERSTIAALDARAEAHIEGLEAARQKQRSAAEHLQSASEARRRQATDWQAGWTNLGVAAAPSTEGSSAVAALLSTAHTGHARELAAIEQITELDVAWRQATELAGLSAATTTAAWRKRAEVLEEIETTQNERANARKREAQARGKWDEFMTEAVELLSSHGALEDGPSVTPAMIEQGFENLARQLDAATAAEAKRASYHEQIDEMRAEHETVQKARQDALDTLQRLAESHSLASTQDLDMLAERAQRAAGPLEREAESKIAISNGLGPGSDLIDVVTRLEGHDEATVEQGCAEAQVRDQEARKAADHILSECTSARDRLTELERTAGAADAQAEVAAQQAEVARLAETWAILALQRKLLEAVLDELGSGDTRPLLDHAGQLLEQLTGGRWVALRAEDDGASRRLRVIRADNTPCDTSQLSEGTADQVFFALRLAAVAELHAERTAAGEQALPLLLDDVLMAFDEERVVSALAILESLAPGLQVIVFTHHRHVAAVAGESGRITVSGLPAATPVANPLDGDLIRAQAHIGAVRAAPILH